MTNKKTAKRRKSCFTTVSERVEVICKNTNDNEKIIKSIYDRICKNIEERETT